MRRFISGTFGLLFTLALVATPALGQQAHSATSISLPSTISASELTATAQLYAEIETIYASYETKLMRAASAENKAALRAEREQAIEDAIQDAVLSAERYRSIMEKVDEDETLRKRLKKYLRTARDE